jgi:hypothetical protein
MGMKIARLFFVVLAMAGLAGCGASLPSLSTGSLFGGAQAAPPVAQNDPVSRALDVGATSARAIKCGYNFDPAKLRGQFLTAETAANPDDAGKLAQIYDSAFSGVSKAVAAKGNDYCSAAKTARIKDALNRHLAGDYTPSPPEKVEQDEGLFSGWGNGSSNSSGVNSKQVFEN